MRKASARTRCGARNRWLLVAATGFMGWTMTTEAATFTWNVGAGNDFNTAGNWNPATVPVAPDVGQFDNNVNGNITFSGNANPQGLRFSNTSGAINFQLGGNTLTFGSSGTTGTILLGTAAGNVNDITFGGGTLLHQHASGSFGNIGFAASHGNKLTFTGASTVMNAVSTSGAFVNVGVANSNNNELNVTSGATVVWRGSINVGVVGTSSGNSVNVNSATFSLTGGARGINLNNGTLNLTQTYTDLGFLLANAASNNTTINFNSGKLFSRRTLVDNGRNLVIGDGGANAATYHFAYSTATLTLGATAGNADLVINSNGIIAGTGVGTINGTGRVRGLAGAKVSPSIIGAVVDPTDDRSTGTITFATPNWENQNIELVLEVGDFPTAAAAPNPFIPLDRVIVIGNFIHGGTVSFDMSNYVQPPGPPVEYKVVGWTTESGSRSDTNVQFLNGSGLPYRFDTDGLYLTVPEPASAALVTLASLALLRRRKRTGEIS